MEISIMDNENIHLENIDEIESLARYIPHKLTPYQIKVLDNQLYSVKSTMWNQAVLYKFEKDIDAKRLKRALQKMFKNHPALSTRLYLDDDGEFMQQYSPGFIDKVAIEVITEAEFEEISKDLVVPFNMLNAPLVRCRIFKTSEHVYWFLDMHHILIDATSGMVILQNVISAYENANVELSKDYYYADLWMNYKNSKLPKYKEAEEYFNNTYNNVEWYNIPTPDFDTRENEAAKYELPLGINTDEIKEAERRCRITRSRIANAACLLSLHKYSGKNDVLMTWIFNNRTKAIRHDIVGLLIKELPIAVHMNEIEKVEDLYKNINEQMKKTMAYDDYDYMVFKEAAFANDSIEVNYKPNSLDVSDDTIDFADQKATNIEITRNFDMAEARFEMDIYEFPKKNEDKTELFLLVNYMASIYKLETLEKFSEIYKKIFQKLVRADKTDSIADILADGE